MKCPNCGSEILDGSVICDKCYCNTTEVIANNRNSRSKRKSKWFVAIIIIILIACIATIVTFQVQSVFDLIETKSPLLNLYLKINPSSLEKFEKKYRKNVNPLMFSITCNKEWIEVVKTVLDAGIDINAQNDIGETALHFAVTYKNYEAAKLILQYGASSDIKTNNGDTPLNYAIENLDYTMVRLLLGGGANPNITECVSYGNDVIDIPLLMYSAVVQNDVEMSELLIEYNANVNAEDEFGYSILDRCLLQNPNFTIISLLVDSGADLQHRDPYGDTPLSNAINKNVGNDVVLYLISSLPQSINLKSNGLTALQQLIVSKANIELVKYVVREGADLSVKTQFGSTISELADYYSEDEVKAYIELAIEAENFRKNHIIDNANTLSLSDEMELAEECYKLKEKYGINFVFITAPKTLDAVDFSNYMDSVSEEYDIPWYNSIVMLINPTRWSASWTVDEKTLSHDQISDILNSGDELYWGGKPKDGFITIINNAMDTLEESRN